MIKRLLDNYWDLIATFKKEVYIAIVSSIIGAFSEAFAIYILVNIITDIKSSSSIPVNDFSKGGSLLLGKEIHITLIIFFILAFTASCLYFISQKYVVKIKSLVEQLVRRRTTESLIKMDWIYFIRLNQGDLSKSILAEGQQIAEGCMFLISSITYLFISATYFLVALVLVRDSLFILLIYSIFALNIYQRSARRTERLGKNLSNITSSLGNSSAAIFGNLKYIRINNLNKQALKDSARIFKDFATSYEKAMTASYMTKGIMEVLSSLFILVVLTYVLYTKATNYSLILALALFIRMAPNVYNLQTRLLDATALISWPKSYKDRLKNAKINQEKERVLNTRPTSLNGDIRFQSISFSYPDCDPIFNNFNLIIKENSMVSILGKSGSGKSTLSDLLTGLIKPSQGYIYIGKENLDNINMDAWRSQIGIVMQDNYLANESIAYNIALGERKINSKKVITSLKQANAWEFIKNLPNNINESVMERGSRFSGGQRQRIALARALYRDPSLLILDEPTSALDQIGEDSIISTLRSLKGRLTILLITHKEKLAKESDMIYVIEKGKIQEMNGLNEKV